MEYNFDKIVNRKGTYAAKYDGFPIMAAKQGLDITINDETIPMMVADMDFECSPAIQKAMHRVADCGIYGYTMFLAGERYIASIVDWYKRRYDTVVNPEHVVYSPGSVVAVNHAIRAFSNVGDGILICRPVYGHFTGMIETETYRKVVASNLINDGNGYYSIDWNDFEEKCANPTTRVFVFCSPANPIGRVWTKEEILKMAEICKKHNVIFVSDEIHSDILRAGVKHHTIINIVEDLSNIVLVSGTNKSFNVAGLHCSNVIIPDDSLRGIFMKDFGMKLPNPYSVAASIAAYDESEEWLNGLNKYLDEVIDWAMDFVKNNMPRLKVWRPEGTYMLWLDFRGYGLTDKEVHDKIYKDANVILQDGLVHDPQNGECFQRMCLGCPKSVVEEAFNRIKNQFE